MCVIIAIGHTQPRKLLADASALNTVIPLAFASEFGFRVDDAIVNGTGAGQPLGMLNAGSLITVSKEAGQAPGTLLGENVMNMYARLFAGSAVWLVMQMAVTIGTGGVSI